MKVIIAGSRGITELERIEEAMEFAAQQGIEQGLILDVTEVVSGTARGVDLLGEEWAAARAIPVKRFPADWNRYGRAAGYRRNQEMALYADALVAVWDGESRGTGHMIDIMKAQQKPVYIHVVKKER